MPEQLTIEPSLVEAELRRRRQASEASERAEIERELAAKAARELELAEHRAVVDQGVAEGKAALEEAKPLLATAGRLIGELADVVAALQGPNRLVQRGHNMQVLAVGQGMIIPITLPNKLSIDAKQVVMVFKAAHDLARLARVDPTNASLAGAQHAHVRE